jgi:drug/metabolite transporter (DMT)-like permease
MRAREWGLLLILSVLWGGTFFFAAIALQEVPPLTLVLARCLIAALALVPILLWLGYAFPRTWSGWRDFLVMAILNNVIPFALIFYGQQTVASGLAAVINATTPMMSLLVMRFAAGEAMAINKAAGIGLGLVGVAVLIGPDALRGAAPESTVGMVAMLGAALSYGVSGLWGRRLKGIAPPVSAGSQVLMSSLLMLPLAAGVDRFWLLPVPSASVVAAIAGLGILSTAVAYLLFFQIMASAGPVNVMLVTLLIPFTSIALGCLFLGEALTGRQIAGAILIGVSLLVIDGRLFGTKAPEA